MTRPADAVRRAVREVLTELPADGLVLVACSGGPDSVALAAATAEVVRPPRRAGAVIVDHGLQPSSDDVAEQAADTCRTLGLEPVIVTAVTVVDTGEGPEAAARSARYQALTQQAEAVGAAAVLLGHTSDDQAETVLLGLARGSGGRSLAGMSAARGVFRRPLLGLDRQTVRSAYPDLPVHHDEQNSDPRFLRARVRNEVLPVLEVVLGPGVSAALARTAELLRADADAIASWAEHVAAAALSSAAGQVRVEAHALVGLPVAVVARVMREAALLAGSDGGRLTSVHVRALTALVTDWHGQGAVALPGGKTAVRASGTVVFGPSSPGEE